MAGMPLTGQGGQFGGPRHGWGQVRGTGEPTGAHHNANRGRFTASPEAGLPRGEWQWRGHGPDAIRDYGWDDRGGVGRDGVSQRTEARMGGSRMAQERSGGLPRGGYAVGYGRLGERAGGGGRMEYDRDGRGAGGGMRHGYDAGFRDAGGRMAGGRGGSVRDFRSAPRGRTSPDFWGDSMRAAGRGYDRGIRAAPRGGYDAGMRRAGGGYDHGMRGGIPQPLSDAEFYRRVDRW